MAKALKEAKLNTSWIQPNEPWDSAMHEFVAKILDPSPKNKFLPEFIPLAEEIARLGAINSLTQTVLKFTARVCPTFTRAMKSGTSAWSIPTTAGRSITICAANFCADSRTRQRGSC